MFTINLSDIKANPSSSLITGKISFGMDNQITMPRFDYLDMTLNVLDWIKKH